MLNLGDIRGLLDLKEYEKIKMKLQDYELEVTCIGNDFVPEYACILAAIYCILGQVNPLRFLIKRVSTDDHDFNQWSELGTLLASFQFKKIHEKLKIFNWNYEINSTLINHFTESLVNSQFSRLSKVYTSIEPSKVSSILGIPKDVVSKIVREKSWDIDAGAGWLLPVADVLPSSEDNIGIESIPEIVDHVLFVSKGV